jgi:hypothetical protein
MRSIIECGMLKNVFGYIILNDINIILINIEYKLYTLNWVAFGDVWAKNEIMLRIR